MAWMVRIRRRGNRRQDEGIALVAALILTFALMAMGAALANYVVEEYKSTHVSRDSAAALAAAEAGLEKAMDVMQRAFPPGLPAGTSYTAYDHAVGEGFTGHNVSWDGTHFVNDGAGPVEYPLSVYVPGAEGSFTVDVDGFDLANVNARRKVTATGYFPNKAAVQAGNGVSRTVVAWIRRGAWGFPNAAVLSRSNVMLGNKNSGPLTIDYDETTGTYSPSGNALADVVSTHGNIEGHAQATTVDGAAYAGGTVFGKISPSQGAYSGYTRYQDVWPTPETTGDPTADPPLDGWFGQWKIEAQANATHNVTMLGGGAELRAGYYPGSVAITNSAPTVGGGTEVTCAANPGSSSKIIYIDGDLLIQSYPLFNPGYMVIVRGNITMGGNGSYHILPSTNGYGLIAWGDITLKGTPSGSGEPVGVGFVYSINGSIQLQGDSKVTGGLVSGGADVATGVHIQVGSKAGLFYPEGLLARNNFLPGTPVIVGWQEK